MIRVVGAWVGALLLIAPALAEPVPEPTGYKLENYRSPTPAALAGATTLSPQEAAALWRGKAAVFIDVMPQPPRPANLPAGTLWRDPPRDSIPGAVWLPNVGYGEIAPATETYFRAGLARATDGDQGRRVVIFCMRDCWMSWNAAKRAMSFGYRAVNWFPEGTDGFVQQGLPLERVERAP